MNKDMLSYSKPGFGLIHASMPTGGSTSVWLWRWSREWNWQNSCPSGKLSGKCVKSKVWFPVQIYKGKPKTLFAREWSWVGWEWRSFQGDPGEPHWGVSLEKDLGRSAMQTSGEGQCAQREQQMGSTWVSLRPVLLYSGSFSTARVVRGGSLCPSVLLIQNTRDWIVSQEWKLGGRHVA